MIAQVFLSGVVLSVFDGVMCSQPLRLWERTLSLCVFVQGLWRGHPEGQQVEQVVTGGEMRLITLCSPRDVVADVGCVFEEGQLLGVSEVTPGVLLVLVVPKLEDLVPAVPHRSSG